MKKQNELWNKKTQAEEELKNHNKVTNFDGITLYLKKKTETFK